MLDGLDAAGAGRVAVAEAVDAEPDGFPRIARPEEVRVQRVRGRGVVPHGPARRDDGLGEELAAEDPFPGQRQARPEEGVR